MITKVKQYFIDVLRGHTDDLDLDQTKDLISMLPEDTNIDCTSGFKNFDTGKSRKYKSPGVTPQVALAQIAEKSIIHGDALVFKGATDRVSYRGGQERHRIKVDFHQNNLNANEWNLIRYSIQVK